MPERKFQIHDQKTGSALTVRVTTRAGHTGVREILADGTVKIRLAAAPVDGNANDELVRYLAELLQINRNQIEIISGQTSRNKLIGIIGVDSQTVSEIMLKELAK
jgi:uncharacterized protein